MPDRAMEAADIAAELVALDRSLSTISFAVDGTILRANENFLRLFGYDAPDLVGRLRTVLLHADAEGSADEAETWAAIGCGRIKLAEAARSRKDGSKIWIRSAYTLVPAADGQPDKIIELASDITAEKLRAADDRGQIVAINTSQAVIHFALDGTILDANDRFLDAMGYRLDEVIGRHHRLFVEPESQGADYAAFWSALALGHHRAGEYKRLGKDGREVWLQATYNPIFDPEGQAFKVVKYATDITAEKLLQADHEGQIAAIGRSHCVIAFNMDGTIIAANDRFLDAMGYRFAEVEGRHHRMFVDPSYAHGSEYANFWSELAQGRHQAAEYKRVGKGGREVWLQASYNPVLDPNGRPFKVVKYATDVTKDKLRQSDHQGQIAAIHKAQCVISFNMDGTVIDANDNFLDLTGYRLAQVRGRHHRMFVEPDVARSATYARFWSDLAQGRYQAAEYKRIGQDGREIWLRATYNPIFDFNGRPFKVVKYATDVTQERLQQADQQGQIAAIGKSQCVVSFNMDGTVIDANANFLNALGYRLDEVVGRHHRMFVEPGFADTSDYADFWEALRAGAFHTAMYKRIGKDGRQIWIQASYNPILDLNEQPFKVVKFATDVTSDVALAEALTQAKQQAQHDAATALPNRVRLDSFMAAILAEPQARLAVLYLDLDRFKPINDTFGHHVGDFVLGEIANRLRRSIQDDQLVARVGGDEFVLAAPHLSNDEIEAMCLRLLAIVTAPIVYEKTELNVGLSIGVAVFPGDAATAHELLRCADAALYRSKANGRGTFSFYAKAMNDQIDARRHLADDMRRGLALNEFFLEYQPRFNARTQRMQSVEALVRWTHPTRGRIEPTDFISLAEKNGLIVELGTWVLRTACRAAMAWPEIGISVNVSPVQFRGDDLVSTICAILDDTGLDAERLELEITEGVLLEDQERAHVALTALKARGLRLAMDDFGTGYSSLRYLRNFPFDVIKIDRRFIADIETSEGGRPIVQAILGLGKALGMSVTAEGVETVGQLMLLNLDECSEVQGYLLARPMSAEALSALLARQAADELADPELPALLMIPA